MSENLRVANTKNRRKSQYISTFNKCVISFSMIFFICFTQITVLAVDHSDSNIEQFQRKRILFISSYDSSFPTFFSQLEGLQSSLAEELYQIDIEYMDTKRFYTEENLANFDKSLEYKLSILEPYDAIVVGDDNALQYAMDNQQRLFQDIPIIFLGINDKDRAQKAYAMGNITGVVEGTSIKETLDMAVKLEPKAKKLLIVVDQSTSGIGELKQVLNYDKVFPTIDFEVFDLREKNYSEFSEELSSLDDKTILLLISAYNDVDGHNMTFYEYLKFINYYTDLPIFHFYDFGIGHGILGGVVVDYHQQGKLAGEIVVKVIQGLKADDIKPITDKSTNHAIIDYEIFKENELDLNQLPKDTRFINKSISFFDKNKELILTTVLVVLLLLAIIIILIVNIQRRKWVEKSLKTNNEELSALNEEMITMNQELELADQEIRASYKNISIKNQELEDSEERYKNVFDLSHSAMWERNFLKNELIITKDWYLKIFDEKGYHNLQNLDPDKILELFYSHLDPDHLASVKKKQKELRKGIINSYSQRINCFKKDNKPLYITEKARAIYNQEGELVRIIGSHTNITNAVLYEQQLKEFAYKDQLTLLPNRIILQNQLNTIIANKEKEFISGAIMLIDIDNFKFINNTYGHEIGDKLLVQIANRLNEALGSRYVLGRISGDEFVLICDDLHEQKDLEYLADRIILMFAKKFTLSDCSLYITVSLGIAIYPENGRDLYSLLNRCNNAIHQAKIKGKNRYDFYDISMNEIMEKRIYIQNNIREAIENNRFELLFQPLYNVNEDRINGFEALIRWEDEKLGFIPPLEFIVVAEKMGLINKLGKWVLKEASKFIKYVTTIDEDLYVSVNVSSVQLLQNNFVQTVLTIIEDSGIEYSKICIEITETALMQSFDKNIAKLHLLREKGIKISLDDFGTGYSSLNYLRRLPVDILKIDKSFIDEIITSSEDRALTEGIILLVQKMGIYVIAEGIEDFEQLKYLIEYKCNGIQGYLISKPMSKNNIKDFYAEFKGVL